jgi:hypothetical protein
MYLPHGHGAVSVGRVFFNGRRSKSDNFVATSFIVILPLSPLLHWGLIHPVFSGVVQYWTGGA